MKKIVYDYFEITFDAKKVLEINKKIENFPVLQSKSNISVLPLLRKNMVDITNKPEYGFSMFSNIETAIDFHYKYGGEIAKSFCFTIHQQKLMNLR